MRKAGWILVGVFLSLSTCLADEGAKLFLGKWNLTGDGKLADHVYWLEVKESGGKLEVMFLNRWASAFNPGNAAIKNGVLSFSVKDKQPQPFEARINGQKLIGTFKTEKETVSFTGARPPEWKPSNANGPHTFGKPIELFDGKSLSNWGFQSNKQPSGWKVEDGLLQNIPSADNLISVSKFFNFKVHIEYKLEPKSNSGIYLRGRYELQVLDDAGKPAEMHSHMSIYGRTAPTVNASKAPGEWQVMEATVVGNRITVMLNGKKVHDNQVIEGITGGALDCNELNPGPLMIQGDHGRIWIRKVTLTPIM